MVSARSTLAMVARKPKLLFFFVTVTGLGLADLPIAKDHF